MLPILTEEFNFSPNLCYLNHGTLGVAPKSLWQQVHLLNLESDSNPVHLFNRERVPRLTAARKAVADFIGANLDELMVLPNATYGVNAIIRSLRFDPGDEVIITDQEYSAYRRLWEEIESRDGAKIVVAALPLNNSPKAAFGDVITKLFSARTKLLFFSHITSNTAMCLPAKMLCQAARAAGIMTVVDGAHVPGQIPLSVKDIGADCYIGNCHKWMFAPRSSGFIALTTSYHSALKPLIISFGSDMCEGEPSPLVDEYSWLGTVNWSTSFVLPAAVQFYEEQQISSVAVQCRELAKSAFDTLCELPGIEPLFADWYSSKMQMFALRLSVEASRAEELYDFFAIQHQIELHIRPCGDDCSMRICINCYNSSQDVDRLIECTKSALGRFTG